MKIISYRYLPLNIYLAYSLFVFFCLFFGPVKYKDIDYFVIFPFVSALVFLFAIGYILGARGDFGISNFSRFVAKDICYSNVRAVLFFLLVWGVTSSMLHWYILFSSTENFGLNTIGANYVKGYENYVRGQASVDAIYVLNIFDQALKVLALLFGMCYCRNIGRFGRIALLIIVVSYLLINVIGAGKQKYLGDIVIFLAYAGAISAAEKKIRINLSKLCLLVGSGFSFFFLFVEILRQRYIAAGIGLQNIYEKSHPLVFWDQGSFVFCIFGSEYGFALGAFLGYFTNGLYGLYLSLISPFEWSFGVGNSYSLGRIVEIVIGDDGFVLEKTYPFRVGEGYGWGFDKWHSLFSWMASDVTFVGVLVLTPFFAFFYAKLWIGAVNSKNAFSGPLFIYLSLGLIFSFSNNQIMHGLSGVIVLFALLQGWFQCRVWTRQYGACDE